MGVIMTDLIEIAMTKFTDYRRFERICNEIMRLQGYTSITPLGGIHDRGQDAISVCEERNRKTVFQYSTEQDTLRKIKKTLKRLSEASIQFHKLIYVTLQPVTASQKMAIVRKVLQEDNADVIIYERDFVILNLNDTSNGIFLSHFPDIDKQIAMLSASKPHVTKRHEEALLKTVLWVNFSEDSSGFYFNAYDQLILAVLSSHYPSNVSPVLIAQNLHQISPACDDDLKSVESSLFRLRNSNSIESVDNNYRISEPLIAKSISAEIRTDNIISGLAEDVLNIMMTALPEIDDKDIHHIRENGKELLLEYVRCFGKDSLSNGDNTHLPETGIAFIAELESKAQKGISKELASVLLATIASMLSNPTSDQGKNLSELIYCYIGAAILKLDPELRNLTEEPLKTKEYYLDTDVLINCIIKENPISALYCSVLASILQHGAKIIVPLSCVQECVSHASYSYKTYSYFGPRLLQLPELGVKSMVWNGFVKGYYYGRSSNAIPKEMSYSKYLKNYYDADNPLEFMKNVITDSIGTNVEFVELSRIPNDVPDDRFSALAAEIETAMLNAKKSEYRTDDQNRELAENDARLYMSILKKNGYDFRTGIMNTASSYLVTTSYTMRYCVSKLKFSQRVITNLQTISTVLRNYGTSTISPKEFMGLLSNPFLNAVILGIKDDIDALVDNGIDLRGVGIVRLRTDLVSSLHKEIVSISDHNSNEFYDTAARMGYSIHPEIANAISEYREKNLAIDEEMKRIKEFEEQYFHVIKDIGRKKKKYLNRMKRMALSRRK
jgi:hypothetical protein